MKRTPYIIFVTVSALLVGCNEQTGQSADSSHFHPLAADVDSSGADLFDARRDFITALKSRGPSFQDYENVAPPKGVDEVFYTSGGLKLKAWISGDSTHGKKRPAVVFLHGGWAFATSDWQDAAPFVDAGYVVMTPMLRGENGNPGVHEGFYGEVDDAIAAGQFVSELPYVDADNVFVAGHSVGGVLAVLTAMMPSNYKAAAALSGYLDMKTWSTQEDPSLVIFDSTNPEEI